MLHLSSNIAGESETCLRWEVVVVLATQFYVELGSGQTQIQWLYIYIYIYIYIYMCVYVASKYFLISSKLAEKKKKRNNDIERKMNISGLNLEILQTKICARKATCQNERRNKKMPINKPVLLVTYRCISFLELKRFWNRNFNKFRVKYPKFVIKMF